MVLAHAFSRPVGSVLCSDHRPLKLHMNSQSGGKNNYIHFVERPPDLLIKLTGTGELGSEEVDWIGAGLNRKENV